MLANGTDIETFDYVEDNQGNIYVVRLDSRDNACMALKPIYKRHGETLVKYPRIDPDRLLDNELNVLFDFDCIVASRCTVRLIAKWNSRPITSVDQVSEPLRPAVAALLHRHSSLFLYGSRLLGHDQLESDWDFLLADSGNTRQVLEELFRANVLCCLGSRGV